MAVIGPDIAAEPQPRDKNVSMSFGRTKRRSGNNRRQETGFQAEKRAERVGPKFLQGVLDLGRRGARTEQRYGEARDLPIGILETVEVALSDRKREVPLIPLERIEAARGRRVLRRGVGEDGR